MFDHHRFIERQDASYSAHFDLHVHGRTNYVTYVEYNYKEEKWADYALVQPIGRIPSSVIQQYPGEPCTAGNGRDATENNIRKLEAAFQSGISRIFPGRSCEIRWQE